MTKRYNWIFVVVVFLLIFAVGCSSDEAKTDKEADQKKQETTSDPKNDDTEKDTEMEAEKELDEDVEVAATKTNSDLFTDLPELPNTLEGFLHYPTGKFSGKEFEKQADEIKKVLDQFPETGEEVDAEQADQYWEKLVSLFAEDYPDPANIVKKWGAYSFGSPEIDDPRYQFKENYNVEIILDSSGSMAAKQGNETRMKLAKEAILSFVSDLPEDANIGLRVYGYKGSGSESDKKMSCASNKLVYDIKPYKKKTFKKALDAFSPMGWTPLADAIKLAKKDLSGLKGKKNTNIIYIVSDGVGTCGGDPVKQAKSLADSSIMPIVNVIGFDVDNEGQAQLEAVAEVAKGTYSNVENQDELQEEFDRSAEIASKWRMWQANSMGEARTEAVERTKKLRDFRGEWVDKYRLERHNFDKAVDYLEYEKEKINVDFALALGNKQDKRQEKLAELKDQIWDDLWEMKDKDFEKAKKKIRQKYNANTDD